MSCSSCNEKEQYKKLNPEKLCTHKEIPRNCIECCESCQAAFKKGKSSYECHPVSFTTYCNHSYVVRECDKCVKRKLKYLYTYDFMACMMGLLLLLLLLLLVIQ